MSVVTKCIGVAKKVKHRFDAQIKARTPVYVSPVRRIERVKTDERVVAMTFDDGPCRMLPNPRGEHGKGLTMELVDILEKYGAKGTFDVVGSTAGNYPDEAGKEGSASWGGKKYDHYPDIGHDADGGAEVCREEIDRILSGGHEITSHTYAHILYGPKNVVYGSRKYLGDLEKAVSDLERLHTLMKKRHGYTIRLSRPPHYVDKIAPGLTSYDALALMGYQYMGASFDGAGWLPLSAYEAEVEATWRPLEKALSDDPDSMKGQIIFQKDGFNMARRTPIADGLERQLKLLSDAGYRVVTVSELMERSPFADLGPGDDAFDAAKTLLEKGCCPAYRDNTVRPEAVMTVGELCETVFGWEAAKKRVERITQKAGPWPCGLSADHPYGAAVQLAMEMGCLERTSRLDPAAPLTAETLTAFLRPLADNTPKIPSKSSRGEVLKTLAQIL